jgi:hypothetical protein
MVDTLSYPLPEEPIEAPEASGTRGNPVAGGAGQASPDERRAWNRAIGVGMITFAISRLIVFGGGYTTAIWQSMGRQQRGLPIARSTRRLVEEVFIRWDGRWYKLIAQTGYQADLPARISYVPNNGGATVAFFPLYPYLSRWFDYVFPGGIDEAMLGVNILLSMIGVILVGLLAREVFDVETAERAMVLFCLFPGAVVMSWSYSEPTLVACGAACLFFLMKERWMLAGIFAALGTATRPNGAALVAACVVAAAIAIHRNRQWKSLIAVVLSPLGGVGFYIYLRVHTGEPNAWSRAQRDAWGESWSWGATAVRYTWRFFENPLGTGFGPLYMHTTFAIVAFGVGVFCAIRKRLPWPMLAYVAVVGIMMLGPKIVSARPRFVWTAFPLAIAVAAWWPRKHRYTWDALVVFSAGSLVAFTMLYGAWAMIP